MPWTELAGRWSFWAGLASLFAALTAVLAKLGVSGPELVRIAALYRCWHSARASGALPGC